MGKGGWSVKGGNRKDVTTESLGTGSQTPKQGAPGLSPLGQWPLPSGNLMNSILTS